MRRSSCSTACHEVLLTRVRWLRHVIEAGRRAIGFIEAVVNVGLACFGHALTGATGSVSVGVALLDLRCGSSCRHRCRHHSARPSPPRCPRHHRCRCRRCRRHLRCRRLRRRRHRPRHLRWSWLTVLVLTFGVAGLGAVALTLTFGVVTARLIAVAVFTFGVVVLVIGDRLLSGSSSPPRWWVPR